MATEFVLPTVAVGAFMGWLHRRHRNATRKKRGLLFSLSEELFQQPRIYQDDVNFPVLKGQYKEDSFQLDLIADHIGFRKLPSLWLQVTLRAEQPVDGMLGFLVRPEHPLYFSPSERLENELEIPNEWPQQASLKSNNSKVPFPLERLDSHIKLFDDPKCKELLITPRGIRLVYQLDQAQRAHYQILRGCVFDNSMLEPSLAKELMSSLIDIQRDLKTLP